MILMYSYVYIILLKEKQKPMGNVRFHHLSEYMLNCWKECLIDASEHLFFNLNDKTCISKLY